MLILQLLLTLYVVLLSLLLQYRLR